MLSAISIITSFADAWCRPLLMFRPGKRWGGRLVVFHQLAALIYLMYFSTFWQTVFSFWKYFSVCISTITLNCMSVWHFCFVFLITLSHHLVDHWGWHTLVVSGWCSCPSHWQHWLFVAMFFPFLTRDGVETRLRPQCIETASSWDGCLKDFVTVVNC